MYDCTMVGKSQQNNLPKEKEGTKKLMHQINMDIVSSSVLSLEVHIYVSFLSLEGDKYGEKYRDAKNRNNSWQLYCQLQLQKDLEIFQKARQILCLLPFNLCHKIELLRLL